MDVVRLLLVLGGAGAFVKWPKRPGEGPVVWVVNARRGWGVHVGDLVVVPVVLAAAHPVLRRLRAGGA